MAVYLDSNATTRPTPEVVEAMSWMLKEAWHNPSSIHRPGQAARHRVELARQSVAKLLNATPREIVLTSGAAESIALAVRGALAANPERRTFITTPIEHEAVRDLCRSLAKHSGISVKLLPANADGLVNATDLEGMLDDDVGIVSVMWANNETGAIQPIESIGRLCRERGVLFHSDATQTVGKIRTDLSPTGTPVDLVSFSAHKFHGPKGAGGLWIRRGVSVVPQVMGAQEKERRGGTENTAAIVGMGVAAEQAMAWIADPAAAERVRSMRDRLESGILSRVSGAVVNAAAAPRLVNTTNIAFPKLEAEALLLLLSEKGLCASAGAACGSGSLDPSPILRAMGVPLELAHGSLRFSLSRETTDAEIDEALELVPSCVDRLRASATSVA